MSNEMSKRYGLYAFVILLAVLVLLVPGRAILDLPGPRRWRRIPMMR